MFWFSLQFLCQILLALIRLKRNITVNVHRSSSTASLNVTAHAPKPDFVFRRNSQVHLNRRGASVQSTTGSRGVRISGGNAEHTMIRGSAKGTRYPLHSPFSPSHPLPCVSMCHHISTGLCPLFLSDFSRTRIFSTNFCKVLKYEISWKSAQREPSCSMRSDTTKLMVAFRNFANAPKNYTWIWRPTPIISPHSIHWFFFIIYSRTGQLQPSVGPHNSLRTRLRAAFV